MAQERRLVRSLYAIIPESVYQGLSTVAEHTHLVTGETIPAYNLYEDEDGTAKTFAEQFPKARQNSSGTKRLIDDCDWDKTDQTAIEILIVGSGVDTALIFPTKGTPAKYGTMQYGAVIAEMRTEDWSPMDEVL